MHRIVTSRLQNDKKQGDEKQACHKEVHGAFVQPQKRFCKLKGLLGEEVQLAGVESSLESLKNSEQSAEKTGVCD